ncbi:hypothetical protein SeMB42_g07306 [Synchytrium endobioticum]|uniref:Prokaryotic-type class I peptide chain release factors domain-containing protein n=1 Tax=Synchytrium endobioticum TaxID=286115 RepID=A0A507CDT5_9FUNG|nr:hypothetical protein SeMB42_g07306 [Synchytrium endobioticum]TPX39670.1 hypothetical protein SeLEV6574_g07057 [Synchytrium endobioticum]TPX39675.1 hypothetical protein SeLEV6574_g07062 [Synchytrium endobioticum]
MPECEEGEDEDDEKEEEDDEDGEATARSKHPAERRVSLAMAVRNAVRMVVDGRRASLVACGILFAYLPHSHSLSLSHPRPPCLPCRPFHASTAPRTTSASASASAAYPASSASSPPDAASITKVISSNQESYAHIRRLMDIVSAQTDWTQKTNHASSLTSRLSSNTLWESDPSKAVALQRELSELKQELTEYKDMRDKVNELAAMLELAREEGDAALLQAVSADIEQLKATLQSYTVRLMMSSPQDKYGCFIELRSGAGGAESGLFLTMLLRMYSRWATNYHTPIDPSSRAKATLLDSTPSDHDGLKSATLLISGLHTYGWLKHEAGIHRLVRISPLDANARRHTSFVSVLVYPDADDNGEDEKGGGIEILTKDVRMESMRAQGAGGQHVNKTESAVRLTHIPTGITVACQNERSQHQNRALAFKLLTAKLLERELRVKQQAKSDLHSQLPDNNFGSQIRSYVLQPYRMIKDLRTGFEKGDVDAVLDGDLQGFLEASLLHMRKLPVNYKAL